MFDFKRQFVHTRKITTVILFVHRYEHFCHNKLGCVCFTFAAACPFLCLYIACALEVFVSDEWLLIFNQIQTFPDLHNFELCNSRPKQFNKKVKKKLEANFCANGNTMRLSWRKNIVGRYHKRRGGYSMDDQVALY